VAVLEYERARKGSRLAENYPGVTVDPYPILCQARKLLYLCGRTAGIDMTLALVEEDLGSELALRIARMMVVFLRRPGGQSQFSATLVQLDGDGPAR